MTKYSTDQIFGRPRVNAAIVTVEREGRVLKRSTGHCKLVPNYNEVEQDNDETDSESIDLEKQDRIVNESNRRYPIRNRRPPQRYDSLHT